MGAKLFFYLKHFDWILFFATVLLISFGLVEIYSVALGQDTVNLLNFKKQLIFAVSGILILIVLAMFDYRRFSTYGVYIYFASLAMLAAVLIWGVTIRGTRGWIYLGSLGIQPVEFAKVALIIMLARYFSTATAALSQLKNFIVSAIFCASLAGLVVLQPDFGSAMILFLVWLVIALVIGFSRKYFFLISLFLITAFIFGWALAFEDYQKERIITFFNQEENRLEQGYNITQAIIAIGAGRITGRGIGFGSQSQLKFLPEAQNDFIFAVISEELGFLGVMLLVSFFAVLLYRLIRSVRSTGDDFGTFFVFGAASLIFIEMFINIGMNVGLLPVIGISLPLVSYGGSGLIATMAMLGIAQSVIIRSKIGYGVK